MAKTVRELSEKATAILGVLKENPEKELTLQEIGEMGIDSPNGSHLKALETRGLVTSREVEVEVVVKKKVKAYKVV